MSFTRKDSRQVNPCTQWYEWKGSKGHFVMYDKEKQVEIPKDLDYFVVLDFNLMCLKGMTDGGGGKFHQFYSNAVRRWGESGTPSSRIIRLSKDKEVILEGNYKEIKEKLPQGVKYTLGVYIMTHDYQLAHLSMSGSALSAIEYDGHGAVGWFDLESKCRSKFGNGSFAMIDTVDAKKGATSYKVPVFWGREALGAEEIEKATELDEALQKYLDTYLGGGSEVVQEVQEVKLDEASALDNPNHNVLSSNNDEERFIFWDQGNEEETKATKAEIQKLIDDNKLNNEAVDKIKWRPIGSNDDDWRGGLELFGEQSDEVEDLKKGGFLKKGSDILKESEETEVLPF